MPARHLAASGIVLAAVLLPGGAGIAVPQGGEPFLLVTGVLLVAVIFDRAEALSSSAVAVSAGAWALVPAEGAWDPARIQAALALLPLFGVAVALASSATAFRRVFAIMDRAEERKPAPVPDQAIFTGKLATLCLLAMDPAQRQARLR
jgi:hypothetical protein